MCSDSLSYLGGQTILKAARAYIYSIQCSAWNT